MRVVILAAGMGRRLMPYTAERPKGLVPIGGRALLAHTLEALEAEGVDEVICVTGHHAEMLEHAIERMRPRPALRFVHNPAFASSNSVVSLASSIPWWDAPMCIVDSDVWFRGTLLHRLLATDGDALVLDQMRPIDRMDMCAEVIDGAVRHLDHEMPPDRVSGEFFGLSRWTTEGARVLAEEVERLLCAGDVHVWYEWAIRAAARRLRLQIVPARYGEWAEVDSADDIPIAEALVRRAAAERTEVHMR